MTLRDQLNKCKDLDTLTAFVEQKLSEAQAETNRIIICVWCGHTIERTGDIRFDVKASQAHEAGCEKNPIRREAQAEMAERCAEALSHLAAELRIVKDGVSADLAADAIQESMEVIRALSPDPHARERWELEASAVEAKAIRRGHSSLGVKLTTAEVLFVQWLDRRIADLECQLAALLKVIPCGK